MTRRLEKIKDRLDKHEAALIFDNANRFYLTGFDSSAGIVFITEEKAYFLIDFRYFEMAQKKTRHFDKVILLEKAFEQLNALIKENDIKLIFTECEKISFSRFSKLKKSLTAQVSEDNKIGSLLAKLRAVKSAEEVAFIKKAQEITDKTFSYILDRIDIGKTERETALDMEFFLRSVGSEGVSFDFIVVSGKNSSLPHGVPTDKKIEKGDFVTMDFGAVVNGYRSDMTRTVCVGKASGEQRDVYNTVLKAQQLAFERIRPSVRCLDVDKAARDHINSLYPSTFGHGLGHSVGIEIHEDPAFNTRCETKLESGMVLTVEPGIYIADKFGVRIEDMIVVTDKGFENITKSPKNLIEL